MLAVAPIAPDPFVPDVLTPTKLLIVMEETTLCDRVAVTVAALMGDVANARQISESPLCPFDLTTRVQVNPPPVTLVTVVLAPVK
jgi:hypothetical protein